MRRGSLVLIGIASAVATLISLNVIFGSSWHYYDGYRRCYCNERYHKDADRDRDRHRDKAKRDSTSNY